jgi:hypothetical protein
LRQDAKKAIRDKTQSWRRIRFVDGVGPDFRFEFAGNHTNSLGKG